MPGKEPTSSTPIRCQSIAPVAQCPMPATGVNGTACAISEPTMKAARTTWRQRQAGPAAVRDRSGRHRAGAERFHRGHDRHEQGQVGARPRGHTVQAGEGPVRRARPSRSSTTSRPRQTWSRRRMTCALRRPRSRPHARSCHPRLHRRGDLRLSRQEHHQAGDHDLLADLRHARLGTPSAGACAEPPPRRP
jgi:hypothetical protein